MVQHWLLLARKVNPTKGTVFTDPSAGFSIISVTKTSLELRMIDRDGNIIHTVSLSKQKNRAINSKKGTYNSKNTQEGAFTHARSLNF